MLCAERMQFIVAVMTKDYEKARSIANARKRNADDSEDSELDSKLSDDTTSSSNTTDSNSDISTETDDSSQSVVNTEKEQDFVDQPNKNCHRFDGTDLVFGGSKSKPPHDPSNGHSYTEISQVKSKHTDLRGKMIRVLPIRLCDKIKAIR